ncbi:MAG: TIGR04076 family protein [Chloroflexota bacterium]
MAEYQVKLTVVSQQGHCQAGHRVGDAWVLGSKTPEGICTGAFHTMQSAYRVMRFGGELPWDEDKDVTYVACPDAKNPVVFEVRRLRE